MESYEDNEIVIVGGGICGLATALAFHRKGIKCTVLERSDSVRAVGAAMIMLPNGWRALDHLGVADQLRSTAILIKGGYRVYVQNGKRVKLPLGDDEVRCLKRQDLVRVLAENLPDGIIQLGCKVMSLKIGEKSHSFLHLEDGRVIRAKLVIGCDGVHSIVSDTLGLSPMKVTVTSGVRGFTYYPNGHNFSPEFLNYTSEKGQFGYLPINDKYVYWFVNSIYIKEDAHIMKNKSRIMEVSLSFIKGYDKKYIEMVKNTDMDVLHFTHNVILRSPFDMFTNTFRKRAVMVAGDALHAMGPFLAQGGSLSLEDAVILVRTVAPSISIGPSGPLLDKKIEQALDKFFHQRKMRVFWIMCQTFLMGIVGENIASKPLKFLGILLLVVVFSRDPSAFTRFDCGPL